MGVLEAEESSRLLDEKLLHFMDQLELLEEKRATFNSLIEQGWFSMTKARYAMGNKQVSALQYASEMEPLVCVHAKELDNGEVEFNTEKLAQKCSKESRSDLKSVEDIGPQEEGVRRRNKSKKDITEKNASENTSSEKAPEVNPVQKSDQNPQQDPLRWFGILVPQSLKQAQSSFKQVIDLSAEIATLQTAVLNTRQELKHALKSKHTPGDGSQTRLDNLAG
ncbi:coiled-coil domain-containing protein 115 [Mugil cephalus]|uniref:coiled-coil domain-containing protein 115 n=1 Tax=Mugil cephalus TaxID=48193 RepID=UPI001FB680E7|nr:coiled-coil domain-containing protein 115 [Mugil cephalus]XP_047447318.1 coiled-coil domain-containing protein 115 [Mugil cephalus]